MVCLKYLAVVEAGLQSPFRFLLNEIILAKLNNTTRPDNGDRPNQNEIIKLSREVNQHRATSGPASSLQPKDESMKTTIGSVHDQAPGTVMERYLQERDNHAAFLVSPEHDQIKSLKQKVEDLEQLAKRI